MNDDQRHDIEFRTECPGDSQSQGYDYGWTGAVGPRRLRIAEECRDPSANSCLRVHVPAQRQVVDAFMAAARASEFEALVAVLDPDVLPAGRPCRNMTPQAMGELVDELEELGYLERPPDPTDRRGKLIVFTRSRQRPHRRRNRHHRGNRGTHRGGPWAPAGTPNFGSC